jgi:hypothetical protein
LSLSYRTSYLGALHHVDTQSSLFAVKCFLHAHPFKVLLAGFGTTLFLTSYALSIVEAPVNPALVPLANAMWLVVLTMGTIGYGDVNAVTIAGQLLLILGGMLMGILLFGVLVRCVVLSAVALALTGRDTVSSWLANRARPCSASSRLANATAASFSSCAAKNTRNGSRPRAHCLSRLRGGARVRETAAPAVCSPRDCNTTDVSRLCITERPRTTNWSNGGNDDSVQDVLFACLADQRRVRREVVEDFRSITTELQRCQDQVLASLKEGHTATMQRLQRVEERLDVLVAAATAKVSAAA